MDARTVLIRSLHDAGDVLAIANADIILVKLKTAGLGIRPREPTPAMRKAGLRHKGRPGSWEAAWDAGAE